MVSDRFVRTGRAPIFEMGSCRRASHESIYQSPFREDFDRLILNIGNGATARPLVANYHQETALGTDHPSPDQEILGLLRQIRRAVVILAILAVLWTLIVFKEGFPVFVWNWPRQVQPRSAWERPRPRHERRGRRRSPGKPT